MARIDAENALRKRTNHPQEFGDGLAPDHPLAIAAQRTLDRATEDFERIKQRAETKTAAWQAASGALANAETWLKRGRPGGCTLEAVEIEPPKLNKNDVLLDAVPRLQRRGRELKAHIHRVRSAC